MVFGYAGSQVFAHSTYMFQLPCAWCLLNEPLTRSIDHIRKILHNINASVLIVSVQNVHGVIVEFATILAPAFHSRIKTGHTIQPYARLHRTWAAP